MKKTTNAKRLDRTAPRILTANDLQAVIGATVANNPLYQPSTVTGDNPLYESLGTSGTNPLHKA